MAKKDPEGLEVHAEEHALKFLIGYVGFQFLYLVAHGVVAWGHGLTYLPLVFDTLMILLHLGVVGAMLLRRYNIIKLSTWCLCPQTLLAVAVLVDAMLIAFESPVVEVFLNQSEPFTGFFDFFGGAPSLTHGSWAKSHTYQTNSLFSSQSLYMAFFILRFKNAVFLLPIGFVIYTGIVGYCFVNYHPPALEGAVMMPDEDMSAIEMWCDFGIMAVTLIFVLTGKGVLERSQRMLFAALETQKKETINQKIMRCSAEFAHSNLKDKLQAQTKHEGSYTKLDPDKASRKIAPERVVRPPSARSAPTLLPHSAAQEGQQSFVKQCRNAGDCLPSDALAWVECFAAPQLLSTLKPGQRILCYDSLLGSLKFAEIVGVDSATTAMSPDWLTVSLADGTVLEMTADHPVECYSRSQDQSTLFATSQCMQAHEINVERDSMMVLKMVQVPVSNVTQGSRLSSKRWIALRIRQPQRHTIFISQRGSNQGMAIGSCDLLQRPVNGNFSAEQWDESSNTYAASAPGAIAPGVPSTRLTQCEAQRMATMPEEHVSLWRSFDVVDREAVAGLGISAGPSSAGPCFIPIDSTGSFATAGLAHVSGLDPIRLEIPNDLAELGEADVNTSNSISNEQRPTARRRQRQRERRKQGKAQEKSQDDSALGSEAGDCESLRLTSDQPSQFSVFSLSPSLVLQGCSTARQAQPGISAPDRQTHGASGISSANAAVGA